MRLGYLVNQYPQSSHSFIRREIAALESKGFQIDRFTVRRYSGELVDPLDQGERDRTRALLDAGAIRILLAVIGCIILRPFQFLSALRIALRTGALCERGRIVHLIYLAEACLLRQWLGRSGVAHLHAHFGTNSATVAMLCNALGGPPFSFTVHGPEEFDHPRQLAMELKIRRSAFVVAVSVFGRSQLMRWCPRQQWAKLKIVRCGVDDVFLDQPLALIPDAPRFVCVGRLHPQKGQLILLDALAKLVLDGRNVQLVIVGDGPMRQELESRIAQLNLQRNVHLRGWLSNAEVREEILAARAMVLPSLAEGLPVAAMEAFALHRPVISTYIAGIPELVLPEVNGLLVPAGSVNELAGAMARILDANVDSVQMMGAAGAKRISERHIAPRQADRLAEFFRCHAKLHHGHFAPRSGEIPDQREPAVSIILVNFNREQLICANIRHIGKFDYPDIETIVVDNGSTDGSFEALSSIPSIKLIALSENCGAAKARNIAIAAARGKYILLLDSDAFLSRRALRRMVGRMEREPDLGVIGCKVMAYGTRQIDQWIYPKSPTLCAGKRFDTYSFSGAGALVRAEAFHSAGGFWDELFMYNEEVDLSIRIIQAGYRISYDPKARVHHRNAQRGRLEDGEYLYYQIRNWIWIFFRYYSPLRAWMKVILYSAVYLAKGLAYGQFKSCVAGIFAGIHRARRYQSFEGRLSTHDARRIASLNRRRTVHWTRDGASLRTLLQRRRSEKSQPLVDTDLSELVIAGEL